MPIHYDCPVKYLHSRAAFSRNGEVTSRVRTGVENVLSAYSDISLLHSDAYKKDPRDYAVNSILVVGSCAKENRIDSDLDLIIYAPGIGQDTTKLIRLLLADIFFCHKPKHLAVDPYVNEEPLGVSKDITSKVQDLIDTYNQRLKQPTKTHQ